MSNTGRTALAVLLALGMLGAVRMLGTDRNGAGGEEIAAFNKKFVDLHLKMDTPAIMALWAEDGVDLMQGERPLVGRKNIDAWVTEILGKMPGYKVTVSRHSSLRRLGHRVGHRTPSGQGP